MISQAFKMMSPSSWTKVMSIWIMFLMREVLNESLLLKMKRHRICCKCRRLNRWYGWKTYSLMVDSIWAEYRWEMRTLLIWQRRKLISLPRSRRRNSKTTITPLNSIHHKINLQPSLQKARHKKLKLSLNKVFKISRKKFKLNLHKSMKPNQYQLRLKMNGKNHRSRKKGLVQKPNRNQKKLCQLSLSVLFQHHKSLTWMTFISTYLLETSHL